MNIVIRVAKNEEREDLVEGITRRAVWMGVAVAVERLETDEVSDVVIFSTDNQMANAFDLSQFESLLYGVEIGLNGWSGACLLEPQGMMNDHLDMGRYERDAQRALLDAAARPAMAERHAFLKKFAPTAYLVTDPDSPAAPWSAEDKALDDEITAYLDEILPEDDLGSEDATERWVHPTPRPAPQKEA